MTQITNNKMPQIQDPRKFFIIYERYSAGDLAKHLHKALHKYGVDVFLDTEDLKESLSEEEWRKQIDKEIEKAEVLVFIVTHSASKSVEIKRELRKAQENAKDIRVFIHHRIWDVEEELKIKINKDCINLKDFQVRRFETREELVREVADSTLITRIISLQS